MFMSSLPTISQNWNQQIRSVDIGRSMFIHMFSKKQQKQTKLPEEIAEPPKISENLIL